MIPAQANLALYKGDWYGWRVRLWDDDTMVDPFDLTGYTVAAQIRDKSGGTIVVNLSTTITLPNIIDLEITPAMWAGAPPGGGVWDLQLTPEDGVRVMTPLAGSVKVTGDVTVVTP